MNTASSATYTVYVGGSTNYAPQGEKFVYEYLISVEGMTTWAYEDLNWVEKLRDEWLWIVDQYPVSLERFGKRAEPRLQLRTSDPNVFLAFKLAISEHIVKIEEKVGYRSATSVYFT